VIGIGDIDEVMRQPCLFFPGWLGRAQIHAAINGHRVATDDFAGELFAKC
jgi:hypothetical protein